MNLSWKASYLDLTVSEINQREEDSLSDVVPSSCASLARTVINNNNGSIRSGTPQSEAIPALLYFICTVQNCLVVS
jgi:hypothetical protein